MATVQNPQLLIETIARSRIYECDFWKEQCFALNAAYIVDKSVKLKAIGGLYGANLKPTNFICLVLKLLQLQPEPQIILAYIHQDHFKYLRALGAFYYRLTAKSVDVYKVLEPLLNDKRKLRMRGKNAYELTYMDEFIDQLLREERVCDTILPRLTMRFVLEETGELEPRISLLEDELEDEDDEEMEFNANDENELENSCASSRETKIEEDVNSKATNSLEGQKDGERGGYSTSDTDRSRHKSRSRDRNEDRRRRSSSQKRYSRSRSYDREKIKSYRNRERTDSQKDTSRDIERYRKSERSSSDERRYYRDERRSRYRARSHERRRRRNDKNDFSRDRSESEEKEEYTTSFKKKEVKYSSKKVDSLFKKKNKSKEGAASNTAQQNTEFKEEMSIEETNRIRISLGLKPLKP